MLRKCDKGYILIEMLVSINILFVLCLSLLPNYFLVKNERRNLENINEANQLLHEELLHVILENSRRVDKTLVVEDMVYQLKWDKELNELCINWENKVQRNNKRCGYANTNE
ncbi:type II secretion system protein [Bacillus sp. PS06]|uniref:type II secretion system protein n=1 Tax=Bacillus sp. PS06 TaxID=2764176 RepID=UPI00177DAA79|nr:type II secretion system protein [Bacillus sp. PS06]MBD8071334.1 type II secretion system protein [Bacillus sp. PS06]